MASVGVATLLLEMKSLVFCFLIFCRSSVASSRENNSYDAYASTECEFYPAAPLYNGGIVTNPDFENGTNGWTQFVGKENLHIETQDNGNKYIVASDRKDVYQSPSQRLENISQGMMYSLSAWVQIRGPAKSVFVKAIVSMTKDDTTYICAGNVIARNGCWSFLKGGFVPEWSTSQSHLYFESNNTDIDILVDSVSLQPFTDEEWRSQQRHRITKRRMRRVIIHVTDTHGNRLQDAEVKVTQKSRTFPLGSAISKTIIGNEPYQVNRSPIISHILSQEL